jgi:hypothetical protein
MGTVTFSEGLRARRPRGGGVRRLELEARKNSLHPNDELEKAVFGRKF